MRLSSEQTLAYNREYRKNNPDKSKAWSRRYYLNHRKEMLERGKEYHRKTYNAEKRKNIYFNNIEKVKQQSKEYRSKLKLKVIEAYGGHCVWCGQSNPIFLTIDHVNNDGAEHRKQIGRGSIYPWLIKNNFPKDNFQLLCWNCNLAKRDGYRPEPKEYNDLLVINSI